MSAEDLPSLVGLPRILGRVRGAAPGPTLLAVAGIHGNEPAGVVASHRVLEELKTRAGALRGEFVAVAGNLAALAENRRFLERDLNRQWTQTRVEALRRLSRTDLGSPEDREQKELLEAIDGVLNEARGRVYVVDLHTTSAAGAPFALPGQDPESFEFAWGFGVTVIRGLQERVQGLLPQYLSSVGCVTVALEGGQHLSPVSIDRHHAAIELALARTGLLPVEAATDLERYRETLQRARGDLPRMIEVYHRQAITAEDQFVMERGFSNLQRVKQGELLAHDRRGEIRAGRNDVLLMPLYQALGDDGFFLCREVEPLELPIPTPPPRH